MGGGWVEYLEEGLVDAEPCKLVQTIIQFCISSGENCCIATKGPYGLDAFN